MCNFAATKSYKLLENGIYKIDSCRSRSDDQ